MPYLSPVCYASWEIFDMTGLKKQNESNKTYTVAMVVARTVADT